MIDFNKVTKREVLSPKLTLTLEIELIDSSLTADDAATRLQYLINSSNAKEFSNLIVFLLRETKSSMWEMKKLEIE